jgi:hypothetical protein
MFTCFNAKTVAAADMVSKKRRSHKDSRCRQAQQALFFYSREEERVYHHEANFEIVLGKTLSPQYALLRLRHMFRHNH